MEGGGLILIIAFFAEPPAPGAQCLPMKVPLPHPTEDWSIEIASGQAALAISLRAPS